MIAENQCENIKNRVYNRDPPYMFCILSNIFTSFDNYILGNRDTPYMVFEYMLHGDLAELLRKTDPSIRGSEPSVNLSKVSISYASKVN